MKGKTLLIAPILATVLLVWGTQTTADERPKFGFTGLVDSFDPDSGRIIVEDLVFHVNEFTLVHKKRKKKGKLSDIKPGTRVGFNPGLGSKQYIGAIWILPKYWKAQPGFAVSSDR